MFIKIKNYFQHVHKVYSFIKIFMLSVITLMIMLILDILNQPSEIISKVDNNILLVSAVGIVLLVFLWTIYRHVWNNFRIASANNIDFVIIYVFITSFISFIIWFIFDGFVCYKTIASLSILGISFILLIIRIITLGHIMDEQPIPDHYDLKDIFEGRFSHCSDKPVIFSEKDVDYDLLGRSDIISLLKRNISSYHDNSSFVIGLVGEWGSGKTTILNNVKKELKDNNDIIVIDHFDPWIYGTQEALLVNMYESILQYTGVKLNVSQNNNIMKTLSETVSELSTNALNVSAISRFLGSLTNTNKLYNDANSLKELIGNQLLSQNKTIVFLIDNIDRAESENIIFLFKIIGTVFDLPRIIYLLSYDRDRVENILKFTDKIDPKYIEKIVQQEVHVPTPQEDNLRKLYYICMSNVLLMYGVNKEELKTYEPIFDFVSKNVKSLRNFKRMINSAFSSSFLNESYLNKFTLLSLEIICFLEPSLYYLIRDNRQFFISEDIIYDRQLYHFNSDKNKRASNVKTFFDKLFQAYPNYKELLSYLFPTVKENAKDIVLIPSGNQAQRQKSFPICSTKFFDLYFSFGANDFYTIQSAIKDIIKTIISSDQKETIISIIEEKIISQNSEYHKEYLDTLYLFLEDIPSPKKLWAINALWSNIDMIDSSPSFLSLNAKERALVIIAHLSSGLSKEEVETFLCDIKNNYRHLYDTSGLIYWLDSEAANNKNEIRNAINHVYSSNCETVIKERINLYDNVFYNKKNIWGLIRYYKNIENKDEILKSYFNDIYSEKNIYRMLGDVIACSIGSEYGYSISKDNFNALYLGQIDIEKAIETCPPRSGSEKTVLEIYNKYLSNETNDFDERGIKSPIEIKFEL